jgi:hypothetical protein
LKDKIISINGRPIGEANLVDETSLSLEINRFGRPITVRLATKASDQYYFPIEKIKINEQPSLVERENLLAWLGGLS